MSQVSSYLISLLTLPLLVSMSIFVLMRRPRAAISWAFAGVMMALFFFFLCDVVQYRTHMSAQANLLWQYSLNASASATIVASLTVNWLLRDRRLERWEWVVVALIMARVALDVVWLWGFVHPDTPQLCLNGHGRPRLTCPPDDQWAVLLSTVVSIMVIMLFISTMFKVAQPRRTIVRRYVVWIVLILSLNSILSHVQFIVTQRDQPILSTGLAGLLAIVVGMRMFLALEEAETGVRFPTLGWRGLMWLVILLLAVQADLMWEDLQAPMLTIIALAAGMAGGGAVLINALLRPAMPAVASLALVAVPEQSAVVPLAVPASEPLRVYLFGLMRVVRAGETLANTAEVWRSGKTRSLLALLALRRATGITTIEIADALWPISAELDGDAERKSLAAMRSYLSTLRRVLEPTAERASKSWIERDSDRYYLRSPDVWVDLWEFEALSQRARKLAEQERTAEALACWQQAVALYAAEGLLPDETNLPAPIIEPAREQARQHWLTGMRALAQAETDPARAADWWEMLQRAEPLDNEALRWLANYYKHSGNPQKLHGLLARSKAASINLNIPLSEFRQAKEVQVTIR